MKKSNLIRAEWPKIRVVEIKGSKFFQVDARRKGSLGKRETYADRNEAEDRAAVIADTLKVHGKEGLALPAALREMALQGEKMLEPYGMTVLQACQHYSEFLKVEKTKRNSATVKFLAEKWYSYKAGGTHKQLRKTTLNGIKYTKNELIKAYGDRRIAELTTNDLNKYLAGLKEATLQYKHNILSLFSQFLNWCVANGELTKNPANPIEIVVPRTEVEIWTPEQVAQAMKLCVEKYPDLILFHAISLFGGLRPDECVQLKWANVHLEEITLTVLAETSKVKETRNVPINDTLLAWLEAYKPADAKGLVVRKKNFTNIIKRFRADMGYRFATKRAGKALNNTGDTYPVDVLRHSYGSYWLGKHANRTQLAEDMGNSLAIIKKHYRKVVSKSAVEAYWLLTPTHVTHGGEVTTLTAEEAKVARMKRVAAKI